VSAETRPAADDAGSGPRTTTSYGARQADALVSIAESFLDGDPADTSGGDRWQLTVHAPAEALTDATTAATTDDAPVRREAAHLHHGPVIPDAVLARIACDASLVAMTHDPDGNPVGVGRKTRLIPRRLRRMLMRRDGGCRFPGCERTRWLDGHHIWHWVDGGPTELENLLLLCRACHTTVHAQELTITMDLDRHWVFTRPDGTRVGQVDPLPRASVVHHPDIDERAALSAWDGSRLDLAAAIDGFGGQRPSPPVGRPSDAGRVSAETVTALAA
uniref:HNH endonuclease signature motif containing protein n=1 Tax=Euzebya sp. TaxID=1971409 RepID=UPI00351249EA